MTLSGQTWQCSAGETFDSIALAIYGFESYAADLLGANPAHSGTLIFSGGEVLEIPVVEVTDIYEDMSESPDTAMPALAPWKE